VKRGSWIDRRLAAAALLALGLSAESTDAARLRGGIGVGFLAPRAAEVADLYDAGLLGTGSLDIEVAKPAVLLGAQASYFRASGNPGGIFFIEDSRAELTWVPVDLVARIPLRAGARLAPYIGGGVEILWTQERFEYRLDGVARDAEPEGQSDWGWLLLAGVDRNVAPRFRLEGFLSFVPAQRRFDRGGESFTAEGDTSFDAGAFGARLLWRFP
jgi:hypothetical protein